MSKAKTKKAAKTIVAVKKVANFEVNAKVLAHFKAEQKKEQSMCEAIRATAKRFASTRRGEVEATLVKGAKIALGTARRQIQMGRAEAAA